MFSPSVGAITTPTTQIEIEKDYSKLSMEERKKEFISEAQAI